MAEIPSDRRDRESLSREGTATPPTRESDFGVDDPEVAVLAAMLADPEAAREMADRLVPQNFVTRDAQATFRAACDVLSRGQQVNQTALTAKLQAERPGAVGWFLDRVVPGIRGGDRTDPGILMQALHWWATDWRLRDAFDRARVSLESGDPAREVTRAFLSRVDALEDLQDPEKKYDDLSRHAEEMMRFLADRSNKGLQWGFASMDRVLMPGLPGDLVEIGGASGSGKSTVARNLVSRWLDLGHSGPSGPTTTTTSIGSASRYTESTPRQPESPSNKIAWLSFEMSGPTQLMLLSALRSGVSIERLLRKVATYEELERLERASLEVISSGRLILNERSRMTPTRTLSTMERYRSEGARTFVLDHINRLDYGEADGADRRIAMGTFARDLKSFAQTHGVVVVALVQLVKMSPHEEPDDSNIRESAQIIEEADKILFVWKPLVQHNEHPNGALVPIHPRVFHEPSHGKGGMGIRMAVDEERVYITPGKQRILPPQTLIAVRYDKSTGAMFDGGVQ